MINIRYWLAALVLVSTFLAVEYDVARRTSAKYQKINSSIMVKSTESITPDATTYAEVAPPYFSKKFSQLSQRIALSQANPNSIEQSLDGLSAEMTNEDIQHLSKMLQDSGKAEDERALAVEILARKKSPHALKALEEFVKSQNSEIKFSVSRSQEFESVMRAQAIEGIAAYPEKNLALTSLNELSKKVGESFLLDRIAHSMESMKGNSLLIQPEDNAALKKLIE